MRAAVPHVVAGATPYRHGGCPMTTIPSASAGSSLLAPEGAAVGRPALEDHAPRGGENDQQQEDDPDPVEPGKTLIAGPWRAPSGGRLAHRLPLSAPRARSCPAEGLARAYPRWWSGGGETQRRPHVCARARGRKRRAFASGGPRPGRITVTIDGEKKDFYIRQLWDAKGSADVELMDRSTLEAYGRICGWTLARAHARSGDRIAIAAYLGNGSSFDRAMGSFAEAYADQNEQDYRLLQEAAAAGRVAAQPGI